MVWKVLVINGPNMNLLGQRESELYGSLTLQDIENHLARRAKELGIEIDFFQSNHEGDLVERIHGARGYDFIIINPAAYTHTSVAIRDALLAVGRPFIEVHMTNIYAREEFRHRSYLSDIAMGQIVGLGPLSYSLALEAAYFLLKEKHGAQIHQG